MKPSDDPRSLIRDALVGLTIAAAIAWTVYLVRDALLLIYISALVAIGLSPGSLLGIVGAILAVPTAAILQVVLEELVPEATAE